MDVGGGPKGGEGNEPDINAATCRLKSTGANFQSLVSGPCLSAEVPGVMPHRPRSPGRPCRQSASIVPVGQSLVTTPTKRTWSLPLTPEHIPFAESNRTLLSTTPDKQKTLSTRPYRTRTFQSPTGSDPPGPSSSPQSPTLLYRLSSIDALKPSSVVLPYLAPRPFFLIRIPSFQVLAI